MPNREVTEDEMFHKLIRSRRVMASVLALTALVTVATVWGTQSLAGPAPVSAGAAAHVRWDIISVPNFAPLTLDPGGVAYALAGPNLKIKFTGDGTFVAPAGGGGSSSGVKGGGTWETFNGAASTGTGTYKVTGLVRWELANLQAATFGGLPIVDHIGSTNERANGYALLQIKYSDGTRGTLLIGCHGPGAPDGIFEGVTATKGYATYWIPETPPPPTGENKNRTLFHIGAGDDDDSDDD